MAARIPRPILLAAALLVLTSARRGQAQAAEATDPRACDLGSGPAMTAARYAIACAEAFVRRNGYTSIPPAADTTLLSTEPGDSVGSVAELLARRRDTLEADAFGVCVGENGEGYVVAFRYRSGAQATARAVVMSAVFGDLRVYPRDFILALVPERREGCRPVGDVAAGAGR